MSRRALIHLALVVAFLATGGWLSEAAVATKRAAVSANTITVCAKGCQFRNLQAAVNAAQSGDTIKIKSGKALVGQTTIDSKDLTLDGDGHNQSILDGGRNGTVLTIINALVTVKDVTVRNGSTGGIFIRLGGRGGSLTLQNSVVTENRGSSGAGIAIFGANLTVQNSKILNNRATSEGGGVFSNSRFGPVTFIGTEIKDNHAGSCGGGLLIASVSVDLVNTDVNDNTAGNRGGGVCVAGGSKAFLSNGSTVERNKPDDCFPADACVKQS